MNAGVRKYECNFSLSPEGLAAISVGRTDRRRTSERARERERERERERDC